MSQMSDREKLEAVAASYHALMALKDQQMTTIVAMIRACTVRIQSPNSIARREGIDGLNTLCKTLENKA